MTKLKSSLARVWTHGVTSMLPTGRRGGVEYHNVLVHNYTTKLKTYSH